MRAARPPSLCCQGSGTGPAPPGPSRAAAAAAAAVARPAAPSPPAPPTLHRTFVLNRERAVDYLNTLERLYVFDGYAG